MLITNLFLIALLIALTAFFVGSEFAVVKVRMSRIDQLISEGNKKAVIAKKVANNLDYYLSACQLGITVTALGLGFLGKPTVEKLLYPAFNAMGLSQSVTTLLSYIIAFSLVTFLHVVVGELAPKTLAIQFAEKMTLLLARPLYYFGYIMAPLIWTMNGSARLLLRSFGVKPVGHEQAHSEEELRILLSESYKSGEINKNELKYVNNIFEFDERIAKEIMVPRTSIVTISTDDNYDDILRSIKTEKYTRYPVVAGDKDNIVGFINIKEFFTSNEINEDNFELDSILNPVIKVIDSTPIHDLLLKMQKEQTHLAILIDEYGGTSGLITVEDILEEIVGEIRDEFDEEEIPEIRKLNDNHFIIDGKLLISDVNHLLGTNLSDEDIDTIGGWFLTQNFNTLKGKEIEYQGYLFKVYESDGHRINYLEVILPK
ncbi:hemolysin family protein [Aquibacillus koreensis]|uniref:Hemolysin family protein n=1 Tax=Aquibacillus koreensis TaxID=279446 RepID=A0A9X4AGW2_9BACI|nr:hemolysin family protein [Aquibacillus koreensis]MCT2536831.1 hemolysin family protein [Aquibacillus koreensis]MDC3419351.1 hemolysin family protein [Aquibacillus koreensis]